MADLSVTSLAFLAVSIFAFAWMVRLGFQVRGHVRRHSDHLHDRIDEMEESLVLLRKDIDSLAVELNDKVDVHSLDKRVDGLLELVKRK